MKEEHVKSIIKAREELKKVCRTNLELIGLEFTMAFAEVSLNPGLNKK